MKCPPQHGPLPIVQLTSTLQNSQLLGTWFLPPPIVDLEIIQLAGDTPG